MSSPTTRLRASLLLLPVLHGLASANEILVTSNISTSTTWTADNTYNLQDQIYVEPGATLTIEPGTVIASTTGLGGSLAVARGAQIHALGEKGAPVIFTSTADVATWTNGDPLTGTWRETANEWGNLTIMGEAYISENAIPTNSPVPTASNFANMEGLQPPAGSTIGRYGGGNDDDDSGSLRYVSIRYGGNVIGLANELNGLSLGGVGRGTDIDCIEIMNNVDDGIEIWGGTVDLKRFTIWNIGDDSLDIDQGWRGRAQFGLIVQGFSLNANQGSGVGDNAIEMDGAEDSFYQPVTTASMRNLTVIGQPFDGDGLTAWRDNARVQMRASIFMDGGEQIVRPDGDDGDGSQGYGAMGTLSFAETWMTDAAVTSPINAPADPAAMYRSQTSGKLIEITDSIFYRNLASNAYTEAIARGVFDPSNNNIVAPFLERPIVSITHAPLVQRGGKDMIRIIGLDPRPQFDALTSTTVAPLDGFFEPTDYRGAFSPYSTANWLCGWSAAHSFGMVTGDCVGRSYCGAEANGVGIPGRLFATGTTAVAANDLTLEAEALPPNSFAMFLVSRTQGFAAQPGGSAGNLCLDGAIGRYVGPGQVQSTGTAGVADLSLDLSQTPDPQLGPIAILPGETWNFQAWYRDSAGGASTSNFTNGHSVLRTSRRLTGRNCTHSVLPRFQRFGERLR